MSQSSQHKKRVNELEKALSKSYVWRIPPHVSTTNQNRNVLLCSGFVRRHSGIRIIDPILCLFATFYHPDTYTLEDIQNAHNLQCFASPLFTVDNLQWYLELHPNGSNTDNEGNVILYLCLAMIPPEIDKLSVAFTLSLVETKTTFTRIKSFSASSWYVGWRRHKVSFKALCAAPQLTFRVSLHTISMVPRSQRFPRPMQPIDIPNSVLSLLRNASHPPNESEISEPLKSLNAVNATNPEKAVIEMVPTAPLRATYRWTITDQTMIERIRNAQPSEHFNGPVMSMGPFHWFLQFIPKQKKEESPWIGLRIWYRPPSVTQCLCRITTEFHEVGVSRSTYHQFDDDNKVFLWSMKLDDAQLDRYRSLNEYTITADVAVLDIHTNSECTDSERSEYHQIDRFRPFSVDNLVGFEYEWKITDRDTLKAISSAPTVYSFMSPLFEAHGLRFYLSLWPNGSRESREGSINIFLLMASCPTESIRVPMRFELQWVEAQKTCIEHSEFSIDHCCGGETIWPIHNADLQTLDTITIRVRVSVLDIIGTECLNTLQFPEEKVNENVIPKQVVVPKEHFEWNIGPQVMDSMKAMITNREFRSVQSEQFTMFEHFAFDLLCFPFGDRAASRNYVVLKIRLVAFPELMAITNVRFTLSVEETSTRFAGEGTFRESQLTSSWESQRISSRKICDLQSLTVRLEMELVDVYDEGYRITNRFLSDDFHHVLRAHDDSGMMEVAKLEMDELEHFIDRLRFGPFKESHGGTEDIASNEGDVRCATDLKTWLCDEVGMPWLYPQFVEFGVCDLEMMSLLDSRDLIEIGITGLEQRTRILLGIASLLPVVGSD